MSSVETDSCPIKGSYDTIDSGFLSEPNLTEENPEKEAEPPYDSGLISESNITETFNKLQIHENYRDRFYVQDQDGDTFLHLAIMHHFLETVFSLIRLATDSSYLDIKNNNWHTPLHIAVFTSQPIITRRLVLSGASLTIRDRDGYTCVHHAAERGDIQCLRSLLDPFKQVEIQTFSNASQIHYDLDLKTYQGETCAHLAAKNGHREVLYLLWEYGANLNCQEGLGGRTPLHYAVQTGDLPIAELLMKHCLVNSEAENYAGLTAYQQAYICNHDIRHYLLDFGSLRRDPPSPGSSSDDEEYLEYSDLRLNGSPVSISV